MPVFYSAPHPLSSTKVLVKRAQTECGYFVSSLSSYGLLPTPSSDPGNYLAPNYSSK